ncbi:MAG: PTS sugar transporter subunit IIA [Sedimenticola sp.]|jgi:PTS system nitrogen regulatory IIA component|nr:MAG: PTS sugar transporter subunit IIA [Sedimenticola sp.]
MLPANFLTIERISCSNKAASKKRTLEEMGRLLSSSSPELTPEAVFDKLLERERLGSTGLGHGIGLPHARMAGIDKAYGAFIQLSDGVDYDAIDNQPVDLVFGLLVPEEATQEHLQLLASLATLFSNAQFCTKLRESKDPEVIRYNIMNRELLAETA